MNLQELLQQKRTLLMGILNITPDSFSDGGEYFSVENAKKRAKEMSVEGADMIDIGGESTRPGSESVSTEEELQRVVPVITAIRKELPDVLISIDTYKADVAKEALQNGANIVNSMGGFRFDKKLIEVIKEFHCPIIIYHIKGEPKTMQKGEIVYDDVVKEIGDFFAEQIAMGIKNGIKGNQFILDPGIGFGKAVKHNLEIIKQLAEFKRLSLSILIGVSRKSHLGILLQQKLKLEKIPGPLERLEAGLAETAVAVLNGAKIIRTHDVWETKKFLTVLDELI